jgi:CBS domain-containing protein
MQVKDAMTPHAEWISPDMPLKEVAQILRDKAIGCLPVGENDRLVGIITDRDITYRGVAAGADPMKTTARDVMSKGITWCFEDQNVDDAAQLMEQKQIHHLPVLSRQKRMVGLLSMGDLALRSNQKLFREICKLAARDASRHAANTLAH